MTTIIVFSFSLLAASTILVVKALELRSNRKNFVLKMLGYLDDHSEKMVSKSKFKALQTIQTIRYILLVQLRDFCKYFLNWAHQRILQEYKNRHQMIMMGQKKISNKGSVSFYLKKISEKKNETEKGKIEDRLD